MNWKSWLEKWNMTSIKFNFHFLEMEWKPREPDKDAAWDLYIELLTRIATQKLPSEQGDEAAALNSIYNLFGLTREIIRRHGRKAIEFTKIAIVVLNQVIRPFTTKWHKIKIEDKFDVNENRETFRKELEELQIIILKYTKMLADMADVEDLTEMEKEK